MIPVNYIELNKDSWNKRTEAHLKSKFYAMDKFLAGESSLNDIELSYLGDVTGKKILHLQCHFGQDTLSLARMGAIVTGIDLSDKAILEANNLAQEINQTATFICCDLYELPDHLDLEDEFDIVFTSYGTVGWLPDIERWADIVSTFLKPGGKLCLVDFHPFVWMYDDNFESLKYDYKNGAPIIETESGTYADRDAKFTSQVVTWNHGLGEIMNSLINKNIKINCLDEYDYSPYNCFNAMEEESPKKFRFHHVSAKIPMVYAIVGEKI
jgi:SAM-dependent methyltransferase